jgi:uncharacterized membrane protein
MILIRIMKFFSDTYNKLVLNLSSRPIRFFVITSFIFGLIFIFLTPPFQNPDEFVHFTRSYEVSELKLAHKYRQKNVFIKGSELPESILNTSKKTRLYITKGYPDVPQAKKYTWGETESAFNIPLNKSDTRIYDTGAFPAYVPLVYLPQAIVIKICSIINLPAIFMLYATRFVGLIVWISLAALSLHILRPVKRKLALAAILLLPMFIFQATSPGVDGLLTGLTILFFAFISKAIFEKEKLSNYTLAILTLILTFMTMAKPVYVVFGLLALIVHTKWRGIRSLIYRSLIVLIPFALYIVWSMLTKESGAIYVQAVAISKADPSTQAAYLIPNVFNFVEPLFNTLILGWGDGVGWSMIGTFGKLDTPLPLLFIVLGYILAFVAIFMGTEEQQDAHDRKNFYTNRLALLTILILIIYTVGVYLSMYIFSTPPHTKVITGIQGRYLLPILPLLVLFITKNLATMRVAVYKSIMLFTPLIILVASVVVIFLRYYVFYPK